MSHPVWVRGLKPSITAEITPDTLSHPVWVRGLKHVIFLCKSEVARRTPCGCVD